MFTALRSMMRDPQGRLILIWACAQILLGTLVFKWLEGWSIIDSLYFSVVTLATVGFGDLHPTTDVAKLFTIVYILFGLGVIAAFITELTKHRATVVERLRALESHGGTATGSIGSGSAEEGPGTAGDSQG
jgi:hypothetical protein